MGGWGRGRGEGREGGKEWERRGNKPERKESKEGGKEEDGDVGRDAGLGEAQKARAEGFVVVEGHGNPWWRVYWWSWLVWGVSMSIVGVFVF